MAEKMQKGPAMEEALREYFLDAGYYAIRGVPFVYANFDVTDIDIWLYGKISSISREISIVDIKNKKTPQAIERIFWVKGLKAATKANCAIVATTDKRPEVRKFGEELDVIVLDGEFTSRLQQEKSKVPSTRLTDEDFFNLIDSYEFSKMDGDWKGRVLLSKGLLAKGLSFDNSIQWLDHALFFAEQALKIPNHKNTALRCMCLLLSFVGISIDFSLKNLSKFDRAERKNEISSYFKYGSRGDAGMKEIINMSMALVEQYADAGATTSNQVRNKINQQLSEIPTQILGEYFSREDVAKNLFTCAKELEYISMSREFQPLHLASTEVRSFIGCILDYWGVKRNLFL